MALTYRDRKSFLGIARRLTDVFLSEETLEERLPRKLNVDIFIYIDICLVY